MALPQVYTQETKKLTEFFLKIQDALAPPKITLNTLKDWGFKSNNHRVFVHILKAIGFLTVDGSPTEKYLQYRDKSNSRIVMAEVLKEAYSDLFLIKEFPSTSDKDLIEGKFKSMHNVSDNVASLMTKTFYTLLDLADLNFTKMSKTKVQETVPIQNTPLTSENRSKELTNHLGLHYNIQIHLPSTKDVEVYNAIFKSIKEHLID